MPQNNASERTSLLQDSLREARETELIANETLSSVQEQGSFLSYIMNLVDNVTSNTNDANLAAGELEQQRKERTRNLWFTFTLLTSLNVLIMIRVIIHGRIL